MKIKNSGNIKLASLLFILGSFSAVLLIPAVIQKESKIESGAIKGNSDYLATSKIEDSPIEKTIEVIKKEYIEVPVNKVIEKTNEIKTYIENPTKIIYKETIITQTNPASNFISQVLTDPLSVILGDSTKNETTPSPTPPITSINTIPSSKDPVLKITKEMVENCKVITDEYNKSNK